MPILQLANVMPGNYGYSLKLLPVLHHRLKEGFELSYPNCGIFLLETRLQSHSRGGVKNRTFCLRVYEVRAVVECRKFDFFILFFFFCARTNLGEVPQPVRSWRGWDLAAGRPLWSLCHPRCWRSYMSRKWGRNNTGGTGFGQTS